jgi:hypothetical protein
MPAREPGGRPSGRAPNGVVELVDQARKPPAVPRKLDAVARATWRELYSEPVSDLWRHVDRDLVLRLVLLRRRLETEGVDAPGWIYAAASSLEDRLLLNPRARRVAGIVYVPPAPSESRGPKVRRIDERRRARIERGA